MDLKTKAVEDVLLERQRQVSKGYDAEHDDCHDLGDLACGAAAYVSAAAIRLTEPQMDAIDDIPPGMLPEGWNWKGMRPPRELLVRAAALCIAQIEVMDRAGVA